LAGGIHIEGRNPAEIQIFDLASRQEIFALRGHSGAIVDVSFSADGKELASAGEDGTTKIWSARWPTSE
jgi:WD40 repeat protein